MPSLNALVREHTDLTGADLEWLHVLVSDWQILADLSFADLVLWLADRDGSGFWAGAQMRPTTGPTAFMDDLVGGFVARSRQPLIDAAFQEGRIFREGDPEWRDDVPVRFETIPVRRGGSVIAVIARGTNLVGVRTPSRLELTYLQCATDLARMVAEGRFPLPEERAELDSAPRVGDGLVRLDPTGRVLYASPNAMSAYRRLGLATDLVERHLGETTARLASGWVASEEGLAFAVSGQEPRDLDVENDQAAIALRVIPLVPGGTRVGALVLARDVTELRRRERELLTKDATIREIHHRVKNNLQTVAALLRMQGRRLKAPEARLALDEAVRRVGAIALVHDTLSLTLDETVDFDDIVDRVVVMMAEVVSASGRPPRIRRQGTFGVLSAEVATPLALVLAELLQNAVEHGLGNGGGVVDVVAERRPDRLTLRVRDHGRGLPEDFDLGDGSLGLQIVSALVVAELGGRLEVRPAAGAGTVASCEVPLRLGQPGRGETEDGGPGQSETPVSRG